MSAEILDTLQNQQLQYNTCLSRRRTDIDRAFGVLKRRFRRLLVGIDIVDINEINEIVMAACVVHNLCMLYDDEQDFLDDDNDDQNGVNPVLLQPVDNLVIPNNEGYEGRLKQITLTNNL